MPRHLVHPPVVPAGGTLALVAPASPYDRGVVARGVRRLEQRGFVVRHGGRHARLGQDIVTAPDDRRLAELHDAFADPDVDGVVAIRGGYGILPLLPGVDWNLLAANPKPLVGLSDLTPLLNAAADRAGLVTLHGPMVVGFGGRTDENSIYRILRALTVAEPLAPMQAGDVVEEFCLSPGTARGRVCGGNLALVAATCGTPYQLDTDGKILLLEDIDEPPYRIHRQLTQLRLAGLFDRCAAIGFGELSGCEAPAEASFSLREVVLRAVRDLPVPVLWGLPFGHGDRNWAFPVGVMAEIDAGKGRLSFHEPACAPRTR